MTADSSTAPAIPLFGAVIGGYGLFGVILEAELELVPNGPISSTTRGTN